MRLAVGGASMKPEARRSGRWSDLIDSGVGKLHAVSHVAGCRLQCRAAQCIAIRCQCVERNLKYDCRSDLPLTTAGLLGSWPRSPERGGHGRQTDGKRTGARGWTARQTRQQRC